MFLCILLVRIFIRPSFLLFITVITIYHLDSGVDDVRTFIKTALIHRMSLVYILESSNLLDLSFMCQVRSNL